jgi:hypothetical protein
VNAAFPFDTAARRVYHEILKIFYAAPQLLK